MVLRAGGPALCENVPVRDSPFDACWHRWERAEEHRIRLPEIWNAYIADHPYDFSLDSQGDGVYLIRVWQESSMPPEFAVRMGEWLYNLRSALDYVMWATGVYMTGERPPPDEDKFQYPIYDSERAWKSNLHRLKHLAEHQREMLYTMQPFNSDMDANFLGWINRLARIDRHRRLMDGTAYLAELNPVFRVPEGSAVTLEWGERVLVDGWADVARVTVSPWREGMDISFNPRVGIDPEIREWSESVFWGRMPFSKRMTLMSIFVAGEIATYEYDCTGKSRKEHLLSDGFKSDADSRRNLPPIAHPERAPVAWKIGGPARVSDSRAFMGEDFPTGPAPATGSSADGGEPEWGVMGSD